MPRLYTVLIYFMVLCVEVFGDQTLYRYEADVFPYHPSAGWQVFDPCENPCAESLSNAKYRLDWPQGGDLANYHYQIAQSPQQPPPTLWVEWRFKSNKPVPPGSDSCDGRVSIRYKGIQEVVYTYGNAAFSFSGGQSITQLEISAFHTFRFESIDGVNYRVYADGIEFIVDQEDSPIGLHTIQFSGRGACTNDSIANHFNEWDFVRYGTMGTNEQVVSTQPVSGALGPSAYTSFTSFLATFDQPNYVYIDDIDVTVTGGIAPAVTATRRTDTHDEHTVEIVLDRALPQNELTTFTLSDGQTTNFINYDFRPNAIPITSTSGLVTFTVVMVICAFLIMRNRAGQPA